MKNVQLKAVWACDKRFDHTLFKTDMDLKARVGALSAALLKAREWLDAPEERTDIEETLKIFIAPENVLIDSRQVESSTTKANAISFEDFKAYCNEDKLNKLCTGVLPELSKGILLIPGTVALKKPLKSQEKDGIFPLKLGGTTFSCGIEICMDHNVGALRYSESATDLQLHFIVSDHVTNKPEHVAVKEGGYVVHASTDVDVSGVFDHKFNSVDTLPPVKLQHGSLTYHQQILKLPS